MNATIIISLIIIGLIAGLLTDVMGCGGIVMIPLMIFLLSFNQHQAQSTSLAVLAVPVTFLAAYNYSCLLYTSPSPRDRQKSRMPSSA